MDITNHIKHNNRIWELDFLRGITAIAMVLYHMFFDLNEYYGYSFGVVNTIVANIGAGVFIFISGISSTLTNRNIKRGLIVFACAVVVTIVSIPIMKEYYIRFGILHFFGVSMIFKGIIDRFIRDKRIQIIILLFVILVSFVFGYYFKSIGTTNPFLFPIGIITSDFVSFDYFPVFPYISYYCIGVIFGYIVYKNKVSIFKNFVNNIIIKQLCVLGKHTLIVYIIHQPILLAILYFLNIFGII